MAKGFKVGSKAKVLIDGKWVLGRISSFQDEGKTVATVERLDQSPVPVAEHRTVYARVNDLRPAKD